ncbi:MAG: YcaO-like family protein [Ilumatobacteraceae bacterium]
MSEPAAALHPRVRDWLGPDATKPTLGVEHLGDPAEVTERIRPWWAALGITRLADVTGLDVVGIPVATCYRPNARTLSVAQGKGVTADAARASAVMEAVEFAHAERPPTRQYWATLEQLAAQGHRMTDPDRLPRLAGTRTASDRPLAWVDGTSLRDGASCAVPAAVVHLDHTRRWRGPAAVLECSSNGLAAGSSRAEAVLHALCELVERDAVARWEASRDAACSIDLTAVTDAACRELLARLTTAELVVSAVEVGVRGGPPVVVARIAAARPDPFRPLAPAGGVGCHLDGATALRRALTEAAQTRLIDIAGVRDDLDDEHYASLEDVTEATASGALAGSAPGGDRLERSMATATMHGDVAAVLGMLATAGIDPIVVDLTDPKIGIPVVKVVAPGLAGLPAMLTGRAA